MNGNGQLKHSIGMLWGAYPWFNKCAQQISPKLIVIEHITMYHISFKKYPWNLSMQPARAVVEKNILQAAVSRWHRLTKMKGNQHRTPGSLARLQLAIKFPSSKHLATAEALNCEWKWTAGQGYKWHKSKIIPIAATPKIWRQKTSVKTLIS